MEPDQMALFPVSCDRYLTPQQKLLQLCGSRESEAEKTLTVWFDLRAYVLALRSEDSANLNFGVPVHFPGFETAYDGHLRALRVYHSRCSVQQQPCDQCP